MVFGVGTRSGGAGHGGGTRELREVVMGLHWDPPPGRAGGEPTDLDALCVLFDSEGRSLEVIHPGHPRNADGSVVHTGDSRTGASTWDDERVFVFLEALPSEVAMLAFVAFSASGQPFNQVPGAHCHVSDALSESELVRVELTSVVGRTVHTVASLSREAARWRISPGAEGVPDALHTALRRHVQDGKRARTSPGMFSERASGDDR